MLRGPSVVGPSVQGYHLGLKGGHQDTNNYGNFNREIVAVEISDLPKLSESHYQFDILSFVIIGLSMVALIRFKSKGFLKSCRFGKILKFSKNVFVGVGDFMLKASLRDSDILILFN